MMNFLFEPFSYEFMRNALLSCFCLSLGCGPVGVFLVLRRMSLMGDALSHAVLPGAAIGYIIAGLSLPALSIGGFFAGFLVALLAGIVSHNFAERGRKFCRVFPYFLGAGRVHHFHAQELH